MVIGESVTFFNSMQEAIAAAEAHNKNRKWANVWHLKTKTEFTFQPNQNRGAAATRIILTQWTKQNNAAANASEPGENPA